MAKALVYLMRYRGGAPDQGLQDLRKQAGGGGDATAVARCAAAAQPSQLLQFNELSLDSCFSQQQLHTGFLVPGSPHAQQQGASGAAAMLVALWV